jgi:hypothetical protein
MDKNDKDSDTERGLYGKFFVSRADGSSKKGGKHEHCSYFVLDWDHDKHALVAIAAYIRSCMREYPQLAIDLSKKLAKYNHAHLVPEEYHEFLSQADRWELEHRQDVLDGYAERFVDERGDVGTATDLAEECIRRRLQNLTLEEIRDHMQENGY